MTIKQAGTKIATARKKPDYRMMWVLLLIILIAAVFTVVGVLAFRWLFPKLARATLWDELAALPLFAVASYAAKLFLIIKIQFNVLLTSKHIPFDSFYVFVERRPDNLFAWTRPVPMLEAHSQTVPALIRHINWWGIRGVDRLVIAVSQSETPDQQYQFRIPVSELSNIDTWRL